MYIASVKNKNLPYLILLAAVLLFFWVKKSQRGKKNTTAVTVDAVTTAYTDLKEGKTNIVYSKHATCRMACRHIDVAEVKDIFEKGTINLNKIEKDDRGTTYPLEGTTVDGQHVRIVFAPHGNEVTVVTVIDLDKDWPCDCK